MHTFYLTDGDLGDRELLVRTDLTDQTAPIEINHCDGNGWQSSGRRSAEVGGCHVRLHHVANVLAAVFCEHDGGHDPADSDHFRCTCLQAEYALPWQRLCELGVVSGQLAEIGKVVDTLVPRVCS